MTQQNTHCLGCDHIYVSDNDVWISKKDYFRMYEIGPTSGLCPNPLCAYNMSLNSTTEEDLFHEILRGLIR